MRTIATRLRPGSDLRAELEALATREGLRAALVLTCVGSLSEVGLRMANQSDTERFTGDYEIVSLVGTISLDGPHLHMSVSDAAGATIGGHLQDRNIVRTTAEVVLGELTAVDFRRPIDPETTFDELEIVPRDG
ncbi:MAG TPA: PPC domain-containing DNA-binding protein [Candidatus Limnocylindrales bacterium]